MEYGKDKIIISENSIRELIEFVMDVQDDLSRAEQKIEMLEKFYSGEYGYQYAPTEVKMILDLPDKTEPIKIKMSEITDLESEVPY